MTDFTPGPDITRGSSIWPVDQDRPFWLRDDARVAIREPVWWFGVNSKRSASHWSWDANIDAIRLDTTDIAYIVLALNEAHPDQPPYFPHYGSERAPGDWDGGAVLLRHGGTVARPAWWDDRPSSQFTIIGYRRRPVQPAVVEPAPDTVTIPRMSEEELHEEYRAALNNLGDAWDAVRAMFRSRTAIRSPLEALYAAHPGQREVIDAAYAIGQREGGAR